MKPSGKVFFGIFLFIIPIVIIILLYAFYTYNICKYDNQCTKKKFMKNFEVINQYINQNLNHTLFPQKEEPKEELVEGFFSGLADWFYGSTPNNLNNDFPNEVKAGISSNKIDINNSIKSPTLSPDEMKDSDNQDLLASLSNNKKKVETEIKKKLDNIQSNTVSKGTGSPTAPVPTNYVKKDNKTAEIPLVYEQNNTITKKSYNPNLPYSLKEQAATIPEPKSAEKFTTTLSSTSITSSDSISEECDEETSSSKKNLPGGLGQCNFYHDNCPSNHRDLGNFSITGLENNMSLNCGNVQNTKPAKAIAEIKNNSVNDIVVIDKGQGFNPSKPPTVKIEGGNGNGASAEAVIDDDGYLKIIKVIHPGYNYTETPNVMIEAPLMNSSCHLCCKL